jgi:gamma-glutamyl:cysteine ligase YbdK (ATP-grasp superfamily)
VFPLCHTALVTPDLEERIQQLCSKVVATQDDEELYRLCVELRNALNDHIRQLRQQVGQYRDSLNQAPKKGDSGDVG